MINNTLITIGLGIISAVVFTSSATGPLLVRYFFFLLTSFPIFLSGLGWGWQSACLSGFSCFIILAFLLGFEPAFICASGQIIPSIILCYLGLQSRSYYSDEENLELREWYPSGRLLFWAALMAGSFSFLLFLITDADLEKLRNNFKEYITNSLNSSLSSIELSSVINEKELSVLTDLAIRIIPAASAISWLSALIFNLWLAGRIAKASGHLKRPWPDLSELNYPSGTALILLAAVLAANAKGVVSLIGISFLGAFFLLYVLCGLAVIHNVTRTTTWRPYILWALYLSLFLINFWIALLVAVIGLLDGPLRLRQRIFRSGQPPPSSKISNM
ncbi:MAG: DUF2232 domain-containing protein [Hyphomicrobium sp.]